MESNKPLTPIQRVMQLRGVSMRELAGLSGESTALVCYIARGLAHCPTYAQLERVRQVHGLPAGVSVHKGADEYSALIAMEPPKEK